MLCGTSASSKGLDDWAREEVAKLDSLSRRRSLTTYDVTGEDPNTHGLLQHEGKSFLNFSSNDYLALSCHPLVVERFSQCSAVGSGASRLVTGNRSSHQLLESEFAAFCQYPTALLFGSGYLANLGVLSSLAGRHDVVFSDRLLHASSLDGIRIAAAKHVRFRHNDVQHLRDLLEREQETRKADCRFLVVTESLFSMTGDFAPLEDIVTLAEEYEAIVVVDEAHALGVVGPGGRGRVAECGLTARVHICTASFGKSFGSYGGAVLCSEQVRSYLVNSARSLIFNTSLPPAVAEASRASIEVLLAQPQLAEQLRQRVESFRRELRATQYPVDSDSQIIPIRLGSNEAVLRLSEQLRARGIVAVAIRPPTVPEGEACIRLSVTLHHSAEVLSETAACLVEEIERGAA